MTVSEFKRLKSEVFTGGKKELRLAIEAMVAIKETSVERPFDRKWAEDLKTRITRGEAITFMWAVAELKKQDETTTFRINGQHSSRALAELLKVDGLPDNLAIHLDTYSVSDEDAVVKLFRQYDARKSARTREDVSGAYQGFQAAIKDCDRAIMKKAVEGVVWYRREVQEKGVESGDDIYVMFQEERLHPFFLLVNNMLRNGKANELKRLPILAAIYGTWLDDAAAAAEFWSLVAIGEARNEEDAATDLDAEILRINREGKEGKAEGKEKVREKVSARDWFAKCVKGWHAYRMNERVKNWKVNTKGKPLPLISELAA